MVTPSDKRVAQRAGVQGFATTSRYETASPGGPAGSALMTYGCIFSLQRPLRVPSVNDMIFGRSNLSAGWQIWFVNGVVRAYAFNSTPAAVILTGSAAPGFPGQSVVFIVTYDNGTIRGWLNGVAITPVTLGTGYTPRANPTIIGNFQTPFANPARDTIIHECFMLDGYDATASIVSLNAQWQEDLEQGRYLTWPRVMTVNDWNWSARDVVTGIAVPKGSWVDRGPNAVAMTRIGSPFGAGVPVRF